MSSKEALEEPVAGDAADEMEEDAAALSADDVGDDADEETEASSAEGDEGFGAALTDERLRSVLESLIFASPKPISLIELSRIVGRIPRKRIRETLDQMVAESEERAKSELSGFALREVAGGYHYRTVPANAFWLKKMQRARPWRLTQATLEVLAIVAYKQPLTKGEVDQLRGVDSGPILHKLLERKLIKPVGRKEVPGYPMMYGTTGEFLEFFGLKDLRDLPDLRELKELTELEQEGVEVPDELKEFEEERRRRIEAEQDGLIDELLGEAGIEASGEGDEESGDANDDSEGVSFEDLSGAEAEEDEE